MGSNEYYYQDSNSLEENPSNFMSNEMNKDYKGEEGIITIYLSRF